MKNGNTVHHSKATINGHPIHPMLIIFPVAFYVLTVVGFAMYQWGSGDAFWYRLGFFSNMAGLVTAVVAMIPGLIDYTAIPSGTVAKARAIIHMALNGLTLVLFAISAYMIRDNWNVVPDRVGAPLLLTFLGVLLTAAAGYYGWSLIGEHKVGVQLTPEEERLQTERELRTDSSMSPRHV